MTTELEGEDSEKNYILAFRRWFTRSKDEPNLCPHGHEDWNDCPVCGH